EPGLDRIAAAVMETSRGFNKKNGAAWMAKFDRFFSISDRVNMLVAYAIAALSAPIVQGPASLLRSVAREKRPRTMLGGCIPQQHKNVNIRQGIIVDVIKLAVAGFVGLIVESGIRFNEPDSRWKRSGKRRDGLQVVADDGKHIARSGKVEERRVSLQVLRRPDILKIASISAFRRTPLSRTFGNNFFR